VNTPEPRDPDLSTTARRVRSSPSSQRLHSCWMTSWHPIGRTLGSNLVRAGADGDGLDQHQLASFAIYMECAQGLGVAETGGMPSKLTTRLARHGPRAAFQVRVEDPRLEDVLLKMGFTRAGEDLERSFPDSERIPGVFWNFSRQIGEMLRHQTGESAPRWDVALREVHERLEGRVDWWLSGSAALAVRGIDVVPSDLDLVVGDARATGEALEDILVEPVRQMPGWLARWFGRAFHGALIEWVAEVDPEVDRQGPHEQGPLAQGALEDVVWEGRRIRCTPLRLQLAVAERRGRVEAVETIKASSSSPGKAERPSRQPPSGRLDSGAALVRCALPGGEGTVGDAASGAVAGA
jgi:hypothetical protein